ncbi:MAG: type II secretion system protein [bacterium]|nr:type II secretion system protein [bacterium]
MRIIYRKLSSTGFTVIELMIALSMFFIVLAILMPGFVRAADITRESETKSNLHEIQVAIERYMADNDTYPWFLLGGDQTGWDGWHRKWHGANEMEVEFSGTATNDKVMDYLIEFDYLTSYPENPFVDDGASVILRTCVEGESSPGSGDPRFGYDGTAMGMGLDDMNFFKGALHAGSFSWTEVETRRTLDRGAWMNVPDEFKDVNTDMYYLFGGQEPMFGNYSGQTIYTFWPGNFFYKATPDTVMGNRHFMEFSQPNTCRIGGPRTRYILGCYGDTGTMGMDVIRLNAYTESGDNVKWRLPQGMSILSLDCGYEDFSNGTSEAGGLPEVFGGGDEETGPWWYYNEGGTNSGEFIYGAPDGIADGVILVLVDGGLTLQEE